MYPTEMLDASVVNRKGSSEFKSGNVSTGAVVNFSFNCSNASWASLFHWNLVSLCVRACNGLAILAKLCINFL